MSRLAFPVLLVAAAVAPGQSNDAKALLEKAVAAHGGADALDKFPAGRVVAKGKLYQGTDELPFKSRVVFQTPDKLYSAVELTTGKFKHTVVNAINGERVETVIGGVPQQVAPGQVEELKTALAIETARRLTPLLKNPKIKLSAAPERKLDGKELPGVKASQAGFRDLSLYFDPETNLLRMLERKGHDQSGKVVTVQEIYSDYREVEGVKHPTKTLIRHDGQRYLTTQTTKYEPLTRADPKELAGLP